MIIQGDCLIELKKLPSNTVDSIVTDPPYELGFMGKSWDKTGIANNVLMWNECLRVLKPGGHLLAFSGTRTYHRMTTAIEDAGFEVRDMIEWVYGSGFPKSLNIGKAVDKLQGNEREMREERGGAIQKGSVAWSGNDRTEGKGSGFKEKFVETKVISEWEGWGTALKPAHEPICMARKPLDRWWKIKDDGKKIMGRVMTVAENVLKWGTGGINIDESRVGTEKRVNITNIGRRNKINQDMGYRPYSNGLPNQDDYTTEVNGRFPANLIHDNSEEVRECFPETKNGGQNSTSKRETWLRQETEPTQYSGDSGSASRFFKSITSEFNPSYTNGTGDYKQYFKSIIYNPKASKSERNKGCEDMEQQITSDGRKKSIDNAFQRGETLRHNNHPTVKPVALMEYLIKMFTPKGGTVLDPFMGSGSTGVAAKKNGYDFIGIELNKEYCEIAEKRINGK